jgi:hypothetical protein
MSRLEMVRAKEYCECTASYLWNGKRKSTFLVRDGYSFCAAAIVFAALLLPVLRGAAAAR